MLMLSSKTCKKCGLLFHPKCSLQKYCSWMCANVKDNIDSTTNESSKKGASELKTVSEQSSNTDLELGKFIGICVMCCGLFIPVRWCQIYCSNSCRKWAISYRCKTIEVRKEIRSGIRKCQDCGISSGEYWRVTNESLQVHRKLRGGRYAADDCVTLCRACHNKRHSKYK